MKKVLAFLKYLRNQEYFISLLMSVLLFAFLAIFSPHFFTKGNLLSLQATIAPNGIIAIGMMLLISMGVFDQSVGSVMGASGILCAWMLTKSIPVVVCILASLVFGMLIGLLNGLLAPNQGFFPKYAGGRYDFPDCTFLVSRGLARESTAIPRLFNSPELVIIDIT